MAKGRAMYLGLCNGLTERRVKTALADHPATPRVSDAYRASGCIALCGACAKAMGETVRAERQRREGSGEVRFGAD